jgi:hypothetical protein
MKPMVEIDNIRNTKPASKSDMGTPVIDIFEIVYIPPDVK